MLARRIHGGDPDGTPEVWLLDASCSGLDETGLRAAARRLTDRSGMPYVTRSYRYPYALVSWHAAEIGVDIERVEPLNGAFAASICTPDERIDWLAFPDPDARLASMWSSKEALAKALGDALTYDPRRLGSPMFWPDGRSGPWRATELAIADGHVAWLCWRSPRR